MRSKYITEHEVEQVRGLVAKMEDLGEPLAPEVAAILASDAALERDLCVDRVDERLEELDEQVAAVERLREIVQMCEERSGYFNEGELIGEPKGELIEEPEGAG